MKLENILQSTPIVNAKMTNTRVERELVSRPVNPFCKQVPSFPAIPIEVVYQSLTVTTSSHKTIEPLVLICIVKLLSPFETSRSRESWKWLPKVERSFLYSIPYKVCSTYVRTYSSAENFTVAGKVWADFCYFLSLDW